MSRPLLPAALAAALVALLVPAPARADPVLDAKDLFERGRELRVHGDCAGAVPVFRKAYALYPDGLGSARNLAECEESLGHFASARRAWLDLKRALVTHQDAKYGGWSQDADDAAARLAPKLATVTIDLKIVAGRRTAPADSVKVTLDGEPLAASLLGTALERDPGRHVVQVSGEGVTAEERSVELAAGDAKHVALRVELPARAGSPQATSDLPPTTAPVDEGDGGGATRRTVSWIVIGVGAASLVGAGVSLAVRQSALSDVQHACPGYSGCPSSLQPTVSRGQTASTLVTALGVTGAVATTAGIVLLLTGPHGETKAQLTVTPTIGGAAVSLSSWSF
jgi:hypothetical protein